MVKGHKATKHVPHKHSEQNAHIETHNKTTSNDTDDKKELQQLGAFAKKIFWNEKALIVLLLLLIIGLSTFFRMQPATLPATDVWAEQTITSQIRTNIEQQIAKQFPNLPPAQRAEYVNKQLQEVLTQEKETLTTQQQQLSAQFKAQLQNELGHTYLTAIDPYIWLTLAKNYEANGHFGDTIIDGEPTITLRNGRETSVAKFNLHSYLIVQTYHLGKIFNNQFTLQRAAFLLPVFIIAGAIIAGFFLARRIGGTIAGVGAGLIIALNTALLSRTPAGFSDTDAYIILFPLLISLFFIETLVSDTWKRKTIFITLASIASLLFAKAWHMWWHISAILMGMTLIYFIFTAYYERKKLFTTVTLKTISTTKTGRIALTVLAYFVITGLVFSAFGFLTGNPTSMLQPLEDTVFKPISSLAVKSVGTASIWPNVLTTVAELKEGNWNEIFNSLGGKLFFFIGVLGVLLTFFLKTEDNHFEVRYAALLSIWFFGLTLASIIGVRFIALMAAPFAIAFGAFFGIAWKKGAPLIEKHLQLPTIATKIGIGILLLILFITPIQAANTLGKNIVPSIDDTWVSSLEGIKENSTDGIITSWWDFGHWFVNIAERRVTFDGGDQGRRIYWVGKSLLTSDAEENKDILRMLNCGQDMGYVYLLEELNDSYLATQLITTIPYQTKEEAQATLLTANISSKTIEQVLAKSHCEDSELLDQYYIVSQDMIGKASVWGHFGSWNFDRAYAYFISKNNEYTTAVEKMQEEIGYSEEEAGKIYFEATTLQNNREVDSWVSPWPQYITSNARACTQNNNTITCTINQVVGQQQGQTISIAQAIVPLNQPNKTQLTLVVSSNGMTTQVDPITPQAVNLPGENDFIHTAITGATFPYELTIGKTANGEYRAILSDSLLARSSFTKLFFFDGLYMDAYTKLSDMTSFRGERIIVYKVDLLNEK